ncbi:Ger(x)C family spore germination protein [Bacillus aerolatus]|uniref:Ger(X)C family spore germination protein n=1 Tax=Bacillus aerolatus TaxID=2653354 RepID=A0A6I1FL67_9BACI|nr:Ger(x)C family spore germination protein [Bacillus aerolatus]KAB7706979.1 Ger(x)C family spore germination protein [Bacillus aerolatus]
MSRRLFLLFFIMISAVLLSGCWSQRELTNLAIVSALGIDKNEKGEYVGTFQIVNPGYVAGGLQGGAGGQSAPVTVRKSTGDNMMEMSRRLSTHLSRKQYFAHTNLLVIGEDLAKEEGILTILDVLDRDPEFRTTASVVIAQNGTAEDVLKALSPIDKIPANYVLKTMKYTEERWGENIDVALHEVITDLISPGKEPVITGFRFTGDGEQAEKLEKLQNTTPEALLQADGLAIIKDGKLTGWLDGETAKGAVWVLDKIQNTAIIVNWKEKKAAIAYEVIRQQTNVSAHIKNNTPSISIHIRAEGDIGEVTAPVDLTDEQTLLKIEKKVEQEIKKQVDNSIRHVQKEKADIFGFGEAVHRSDPAAWKKWKHEWNDLYFPELQVNMTVDAFVRRSGLRNKSYLSEVENNH